MVSEKLPQAPSMYAQRKDTNLPVFHILVRFTSCRNALALSSAPSVVHFTFSTGNRAPAGWSQYIQNIPRPRRSLPPPNLPTHTHTHTLLALRNNVHSRSHSSLVCFGRGKSRQETKWLGTAITDTKNGVSHIIRSNTCCTRAVANISSLQHFSRYYFDAGGPGG